MEIKNCPKCQATWMEGQHYWSTGALGNEADLAGLVCDKYGDENCINPLKGTEHNGDTWEKRLEDLNIRSEKRK